MRELLIGCGNRREKRMDPTKRFKWHDLTTLDHDPNCGADIVHDLEDLPWPINDDSFDECHAYCVLEHLGRQGDWRSFFAHFGEIYRILKPGGHLFAVVPSRMDKWLWGDPSHTRVIQPESLVFLSQQEYRDQVGRTPMTDFRHTWKGDFETVGGKDNGADFYFALKAHKPARY
jgi:SAM-dependent methyltransferase